MLCERCRDADPAFRLPRCSLLLPRRGGGCTLRCRARRLVAVTATEVDVGDAHIAAFIRPRTGMPLIWSARIARILVRVDIGLCVGSLHSHDQSQNTQASDQSALHHTSSLSTSKCHSFYLVASTSIKSKRQRPRDATFLNVA